LFTPKLIHDWCISIQILCDIKDDNTE
jgi:hypothetical protein